MQNCAPAEVKGHAVPAVVKLPKQPVDRFEEGRVRAGVMANTVWLLSAVTVLLEVR